jgi:hypothetical protein
VFLGKDITNLGKILPSISKREGGKRQWRGGKINVNIDLIKIKIKIN